MKFIDCPIIGVRPHTEFSISGVVDVEPEEIIDLTPAAWTFDRNSVPIERVEQWYHLPTQLWFDVTRNTGTDEISLVAIKGEENE